MYKLSFIGYRYIFTVIRTEVLVWYEKLSLINIHLINLLHRHIDIFEGVNRIQILPKTKLFHAMHDANADI